MSRYLHDYGRAVPALLGRMCRSLMGDTGLQFSVLCLGDSVGQHLHREITSDLESRIGLCGLGVGSHALQASTGAVAWTAFDYSYWPNGIHLNIEAGASATLQSAGGAGFWATKYWCTLAHDSGLGVALVELLATDGTVIESQTVDTAGHIGASTVQFVQPTATHRRIRVIASGGRVSVLSAFGYQHLTGGIVRHMLARGGETIRNMASVPAPILAHVYQLVAPDLVTFSAREQGQVPIAELPAYISEHLTLLHTKLRGAHSGGAWLVCGATAAIADAGLSDEVAPSRIENDGYHAWCQDNGIAFFDAWRALGNWAEMQSRGNPGDGVHASFSEQRLLASLFFSESGWYDVPGSPVTQPIKNRNTRTLTLRVTSDLARTDDNGGLSTGATGDVYVQAKRWTEIHTENGNGARLNRVARFSGPDNGSGGQGFILLSGLHSANAAYYSRDGEMGIYVHPTTGVVTLYARVNGALKSMALGALT